MSGILFKLYTHVIIDNTFLIVFDDLDFWLTLTLIVRQLQLYRL